MSDYTQTTLFAPKDGLTTGDPDKLVRGTEIDAELSAISTAILSKYDSADVASQGEAEGLTTNAKLLTPLGLSYVINNIMPGDGVSAASGVLAVQAETNFGLASNSSGVRMEYNNLPAAVPFFGDSMMFFDNTASKAPRSCTVQELMDNALATTGAFGACQLAETGETLALTATDRVVTPSNLSSLAASETQRGIMAIATTAEVTAGSINNKAVSPAKLDAEITARLPGDASQVLAGVTRYATQAEVNAGASSITSVTPDKLQVKIDAELAALPNQLPVEGSFVANLTGFSVLPSSRTVWYSYHENGQCTLRFNFSSGTSNDALAFDITNLPAALWPGQPVVGRCLGADDDGINQEVRITIQTSGNISFDQIFSNWTATGTKSIDNGTVITYPLGG